MTEKVAQTVKAVSSKVSEAICRANYESGMGDGVMIAGVVLFFVGAWIRSKMKRTA